MCINGSKGMTYERMFIIGCWLVGLALIGTCCLGALDHPFAHLGVAVVIAGSVRQVLAGLGELRERESAAFELGRESVHHIRR